jgi:hypothetical protein
MIEYLYFKKLYVHYIFRDEFIRDFFLFVKGDLILH